MRDVRVRKNCRHPLLIASLRHGKNGTFSRHPPSIYIRVFLFLFTVRSRDSSVFFLIIYFLTLDRLWNHESRRKRSQFIKSLLLTRKSKEPPFLPPTNLLVTTIRKTLKSSQLTGWYNGRTSVRFTV